MKSSRALFLPLAFASVLLISSCLTALAQETTIAPRVTEAVDVNKLVTLRGNTHPLARPEFDRGAAPDSQPIRRMLLVLQRSPEQEAGLRQLLDEQQTKSSPNFHRWLTPGGFGKRFGPSDEDIQAVTDWLTTQGFEVSRVAAGRTVIEFSGTAGQVRSAFRTEIHKYAVNGEEHAEAWANSSDPQIPAALADVVAGLASLNNFPRRPMIHTYGAFGRSKTTGKIEPLYTVTSQGTTYYVLGPADFGTIYDVQPLWNAGIDGTGQTIAIVGESNINVSDAAAFRRMWNLPANPPQVILDGPDPGLQPDEGEADADTQWSGAVARGATIDLVVSQTTETTAGIDLSALYIVDNNMAPAMSESYGACESDLGTSGNAYYSSLWQQASAQGITVIVAAGDAGSDVCDYIHASAYGQPFWATTGLSVSGTASTPYNVAIGGTDFDDASDQSTYWSSTNNSQTAASVRSYIPERTWSESSCAFGELLQCSSWGNWIEDLTGGSGGPSSCSQVTSDGGCASGYAKPAWQTGVGVPNDGVRDLPDVSLYAASPSGLATFYALCESDAMQGTPCSLNAFIGAGGTSFSAPAFAGIMAMVVQKTGERQGNANYVLYPLAAQSGASCTSNTAAVGKPGCIFYDVVTGNNSVACHPGSPNCSSTSSVGILVEPNSPTTPAWTTTAGYDLATGLGSVNAANLVNKWASVSFTPSTTTLSLSTTPATSPITLAHGQPLNVNITVAPQSGTRTPTGDASLIAQVSNSGGNSPTTNVGEFTLSSGAASGTTDMLPGGTYNVVAHYAGDGTFGASDSPPVQVTVSKESSQSQLFLVTYDPNTGKVIDANTKTAVYGSTYLLRVSVGNSAGTLCQAYSLATVNCPTGSVTLTDNGQKLDAGSYALNSQGYTEDFDVFHLTGGTHPLQAQYSGDNSYNSSTANASIVITPASTNIGDVVPTGASNITVNVAFTASANVFASTFGVPPSGKVTFLSDNTQLPGTVTYTPVAGSPSQYVFPYLEATLNNTSVSNSGNHILTVNYSGDSNYAPSSTQWAFDAKYNPTAITVFAAPPIVYAGTSVAVTALIDTANTNLPPSGAVWFYGSGNDLYGQIGGVNPTTDMSGHSAGEATITYTPQATETFSVNYSGDANYYGGQANGAGVFVFAAGTGPDFMFQNQNPPASVTAGGSASTQFSLIPSPGVNATVALTCSVPSNMAEATCSLSPTSVTLTDQAISTSTLKVTTTGPHTVGSLSKPPSFFGSWRAGAVLASLILLALPVLKRRRSLAVAALLVALWAAGATSCGGGGGGGGGHTDPGTAPGDYLITVTGTATIGSSTVTHMIQQTFRVQ